MRQLLLVDGSSLLSTSFFGNLPRDYYMAKTEEDRQQVFKRVLQTPDGQYTNGVFTMMKTLEKIIHKQKPTHLSVAWDLSRRDTFRRKMYPDYKGTRAETRPELKSQFPLAQRVLESMNISQFVFSGFEADDIIGTLSHRFGGEIPVCILTKDQDALQLVDEHVRVWLMTSKAQEMYDQLGVNRNEFNIPDNVFEFTPLYIEEFYGVTPRQIVDKKALEGDTSDNIPGVRGVGEKTVTLLLSEFNTVESIYEFIEDTPEKEIKAFFKELGIARSPLSYLTKTSDTELVGKEAALLSKTLATIDRQIPALENVQLSDLELHVNEAGRRSVYEELSFTSMIA